MECDLSYVKYTTCPVPVDLTSLIAHPTHPRITPTQLAVWGERLAGSGKALLGHSPRDAVGGVSGGVASVAGTCINMYVCMYV